MIEENLFRYSLFVLENSNSPYCVSVTDELKFIEASKMGNLVPLHRCIFSDHLTPVLAYRCLVKEDDRDAPSFLFESVEPGFRASNVVRTNLLMLEKNYHVNQR